MPAPSERFHDDNDVHDDHDHDDGDDLDHDDQEEDLIQQPGHLASAEREIERFERKFILPLQSSLVSSLIMMMIIIVLYK